MCRLMFDPLCRPCARPFPSRRLKGTHRAKSYTPYVRFFFFFHSRALMLACVVPHVRCFCLQGTFSSRRFNAHTSSNVSARWAMAASGCAAWTAWRSKINASSTLSVSLAPFFFSFHRALMCGKASTASRRSNNRCCSAFPAARCGDMTLA
jgi:hypothetical protein